MITKVRAPTVQVQIGFMCAPTIWVHSDVLHSKGKDAVQYIYNQSANDCMCFNPIKGLLIYLSDCRISFSVLYSVSPSHDIILGNYGRGSKRNNVAGFINSFNM